MPNITCISVCKYLRLLRGKVDIALQSIKQTSYKGTIDCEHSAPTNLVIEVDVYKNMNIFKSFHHQGIHHCAPLSAYEI